jgi:manganese/zinc/iron transport system permease protein
MTAVACAIPGTFLVLRKMTMLSDAISHSILLGIVGAYFFVQRLDSPILVLAAAATGIVTVLLVEALLRTRLVKEDAAIGVVYPFMFAVAIILISLFASKVHIDTDSVLLGELAFAPLNRFVVNGVDIGPVACYQIGGIMLMNILLVLLFYKEIRLAVFDAHYAASLNFAPKRFLYGLMVIVSFTTVVAFEVAGAIMVVGFIVGPAVIASFYSRKLGMLLFLACVAGIASSLTGYAAAHVFDVSIAGAITVMIGVIFTLSLILAPGTGLISQAIRRKRQKTEFAITLLLVHLYQHEAFGDAEEENCLESIPLHFNWTAEQIEIILSKVIERNLAEQQDSMLMLTEEGRMLAQSAMQR